MERKFIFILGGARSGKSGYAVELAKGFSKPPHPNSRCEGKQVAYIATSIWIDKETEKRIEKHKKLRPSYWRVFEEGKDIPSLLNKLKKGYEVVLIDCLTVYISNLLIDRLKDQEIEERIRTLLSFILAMKENCHIILVSNEVGEGIIPKNQLARQFRDIVGFANQIMAEKADEVIFMHAGIPMKIK